MKILIIGCGRSGTTYTAKIFQSCGLDVRHESEGGNGRVDWKGVAGSHKKYNEVWHQVRNPLDVIASWHTVMDSTWNFVRMIEPKIDSKDLLRGSMQYWLYWNQICQEKASWTYKVEDLVELLPQISQKIGYGLHLNKYIPSDVNSRKKAANKPKGTKHKFYPTLTWRDLESKDKMLTEEIKALGRSYGYDL